jgi:aspartate/methionine/tyrosine aminotransferase
LQTSKRSEVAPFLAMDVLERANALARAGRPVFHLETGQPGTKAPGLALAAVSKAIGNEVLGYTEALGLPPLRERLARHYRENYGLNIGAERIVITTGSSAGFLLAFLALFDAGDTLAMAAPGYPAYRNIALAMGLVPQFIACREDVSFRLTARAVEAAARADGLLIASPANPSGTMITDRELEAITAVCKARGQKLISDEIYHGITYGGRGRSVLSFSDDVIVINSFSKYFSMTGWRIGWMVVPSDLVRTIERLSQNFYISPPTVSQVAAHAALDAVEELDGHVRTYAANRERLQRALVDSGFGYVAPADGAFYLYANVSPFGLDAGTLAKRMLDEAGVAATPGIDFDPDEGNRWLRFSYAASPDEIERAAGALVSWCKRLR